MSDEIGRPLAPQGNPASGPMGGTRQTHEVVDAALRMVTALARGTVDNADGVSVTLERYGRLMTVAASDDAILQMDRHQYESGEGPCLEAKSTGHWYYIESLEDEARWPTFVPLALAQGIHSVLSSPLMTVSRPQGALNIYSNTIGAFGTREQELAALFATQASNVLTAANVESTDEEMNARWTASLVTRQTIARAEGVIMARDEVGAVVASARLRRLARDRSVTVAEHARRLVESIDDGADSGV